MMRFLTLALALGLAGGAGVAVAQSPAAGQLKLSPCSADVAPAPARCGTFTVWENRAARTGRTIDLNVVVLKATAKDPQPDALFFFVGGPGGAATTTARGIGRSPLRLNRDVVLVDQRGTGKSNGLFCGPGDHAPAQAFMATLDPERAQRCLEELSGRADLRYYLTPYAMDDLDDVRAALGYDQVDLMGGSYGTRAALVYLRRHGDHVRSVILQGSTAMSHPMPGGFARAAEDAMDGVLADCAAEAACAKAFPHLPSDYHAAVAGMDSAPREYTIRDPRDGSEAPVRFTATDFAESLRAMLYSPATARNVPLFLHHAADTGDYRPFAAFQLDRNIELSHAIADGMYLAVTCTEDVARSDTAAVYAAGKGTFLDHRARAHIESCRGWPRGDLPDGYGLEVASDVPVLIITGQYDPATPPDDARAAASRLTNARIILVPHGGHGAGGLVGAACVPLLMLQFLETPDPAKLDPSKCLKGIHRPPFRVQPLQDAGGPS